MTRIGVIHYNFPRFSFQDFLCFAAETGYQYVELQINDVCDEDFHDAEHKAESVRRQLESHGLKASALAARNDFVQLEEEAVKFQVARMRRVGVLTKILNEEAVIRSEGGAPKDEVPPERWQEAMVTCFSRCVEFAEEMNIGIAIDNHGIVTNDGDLLYTVLQQVAHPLIGTNLDTMNYRWYGHDIATCNRFYEMLAPHTLHTHFKDGFDSRQNYKGAALGDGEIDLQHALDCLNKASYNGVYCAEYEGPEAAGGVGYRKCYEWLKANVR